MVITKSGFEIRKIYFTDNIVREKIIEMKEKGNTAFKKREYEEALIFYNRAIFMVNGYENLTREAAIVLTNRSLVHSTLHNVIFL